MTSLNTILVARDFSSISDQALHAAADLAERTGATLHVLFAEVLHESALGIRDDGPDPDTEARLRTDAEGNAVEEGRTVDVQTAIRRDVAAAPAILSYASDIDADVIVMGTHGRRGVRRMLLGSVAEEVVRRADRSVLTVRGTEDARVPTDVSRILVPVDFSDFSRDGLRVGRHWANLYGAALDVVHVIEETLPPAYYVGGVRSIDDVEPDVETKARAALREFANTTEGPEVDLDVHVRRGRAVEEIASLAEQVDLVIAPTHGQTGLERFFLGSVTEKVIRHVTCPVLTVKSFGKPLLPESAKTEEATT